MNANFLEIRSQLSQVADLTEEKSRRLTTGRYGKHVTAFPSQKNSQMIMCETLLEAEFCIHLERTESISRYYAQPFTINFFSPKFSYTPDFLVNLQDGSFLIYELKASLAAADPRKSARLATILENLALCDIYFECVTESQLSPRIQTRNLTHLYFRSFGANTKSPREITSIIASLPGRRCSIKELLNRKIRIQDIAYSLFNGKIHTILNRPLHLNSEVFLSEDLKRSA